MEQVWSCGGGVQSAAVAALVVQGRLPKPDRAVIVDTEREKASTWEYLDRVLQPALAGAGVDLVRVAKSRYATVDLWRDGDVLIPAYTTQRDEGKLPTYCSNEWKRRVLQRYLRDQGVQECECWIGLSTDELHRVRAPQELWFRERYPLIFDVPMRRGGCIELVKRMGWPPAPRSSCWMCPHHDDQEWLSMRPDDMQRAIQFEHEIQKRDPDLFLHRSCKPLATVNFSERMTEKEGCQTGFCFV